MPADRSQKQQYKKRPQNQNRDGANAAAGPSERKHKVPTLQARDGLMGVSKIKGQIRQTKRLLAKENIEPGLRVATQRRLTSLEADLAAAEKRGVEKKNGQKYHAVKFFERQKLGRIIKRLVRELETEGEESGDKKKSKKEKKRAATEAQLTDARVMYNYVLNFPNTQKYIALFAERDSDELALPAYLSEDAPAEGPAAQRREILLEMKKLMESGALPTDPEKEAREGRQRVEIGDREKKASTSKEAAEEAVDDEDDFFDNE